MIIINKFNTKEIDKIDKICAIVFECICFVFLGLLFKNFYILSFGILFLPILVVLTLIIHEVIHIFCFKIFNKEAKIKVINNHFKQIFIYQSNKNVYYNKLQTSIILLAPFIFINILTVFILNFITKDYLFFLISINCVINIMGSVTDVVSVIKIWRTYFKYNIFINYELNKDGVIMVINKKDLN